MFSTNDDDKIGEITSFLVRDVDLCEPKIIIYRLLKTIQIYTLSYIFMVCYKVISIMVDHIKGEPFRPSKL